MDLTKRNEEIYRLHIEGRLTYQQIGDKHNISKQRVEQIISKQTALPKLTHKRTHQRILSGRRVRDIVRLRDDNTCQECGKKWKKDERKLDVHHINGLCGKVSPVKDTIENIHNMITLCHTCHYNHAQHSLNSSNRKRNWQKDIEAIKHYQSRGLNISEIARLMGKHRTQVRRLIKYGERDA